MACTLASAFCVPSDTLSALCGEWGPVSTLTHLGVGHGLSRLALCIVGGLVPHGGSAFACNGCIRDLAMVFVCVCVCVCVCVKV